MSINKIFQRPTAEEARVFQRIAHQVNNTTPLKEIETIERQSLQISDDRMRRFLLCRNYQSPLIWSVLTLATYQTSKHFESQQLAMLFNAGMTLLSSTKLLESVLTHTGRIHPFLKGLAGSNQKAMESKI